MPGKRIFAIPSTQFAYPYNHMATDWGSPIVPNCDEVDPNFTQPTVAQFSDRFPEFQGEEYPDDLIRAAIDEAMKSVDNSWIPGNGQLAVMLLAAHYLTLQAYAAVTLPDPEAAMPGNRISSIGFDTMRVSFAAISAGSATKYDFGSTPYGQRYLSLLTVNKPAILIV